MKRAEARRRWDAAREAFDAYDSTTPAPNGWVTDSDTPGVPHPSDYYPGVSFETWFLGATSEDEE